MRGLAVIPRTTIFPVFVMLEARFSENQLLSNRVTEQTIHVEQFTPLARSSFLA